MNVPDARARENLKRLAVDVLEPLRLLEIPGRRQVVGRLFVESAYRSKDVNAAVGGAPDSYHLEGLAGDVDPMDEGVTEADVMSALVASSIPYDLVIYERPIDAAWIHVQIPRRGVEPRKLARICVSPGRYIPWHPGHARVRRSE